MVKDAIKYAILIVIVIAIVLVIRNLITSDTKWTNKDKKKEIDKTEEIVYSANIKLVDKDNDSIIKDAELVLKNNDNKEIDKWTTTDEAHKVSDLKKGTYIVEELTSPSGYILNEEGLTFKIEDSNVEVIMYSETMSEEEILEQEEEERIANTEGNEVDVDNTASEINRFKIFISALVFVIGIGVVSYNIKLKNKLF